MKKTILFIIPLMFFASTLFAEISPADKVEMSEKVMQMADAVNTQNLKVWKNMISPTARAGLQDEILASFAGRTFKFEENVKSFKDVEDGRVKVKGSYSFQDGNTSVSGMSNYFIFEKVGDSWKLYDTNFHQKFDGKDVFVLVGIIFAVIFVALIPMLAFWIWMLVDAINKPGENKVPWILVLIFAGIVGAILYFFLVYRKRQKANKQA